MNTETKTKTKEIYISPETFLNIFDIDDDGAIGSNFSDEEEREKISEYCDNIRVVITDDEELTIQFNHPLINCEEIITEKHSRFEEILAMVICDEEGSVKIYITGEELENLGWELFSSDFDDYCRDNEYGEKEIEKLKEERREEEYYVLIHCHGGTIWGQDNWSDETGDNIETMKDYIFEML